MFFFIKNHYKTNGNSILKKNIMFFLIQNPGNMGMRGTQFSAIIACSFCVETSHNNWHRTFSPQNENRESHLLP